MYILREEKATEAEVQERLTVEVAAHLGEGWSVKRYPQDPEDHWAGNKGPDIIHTDGRSFDVAICSGAGIAADRGKVWVSANWPSMNGEEWGQVVAPSNLYNPEECSPAIKISLSRGPRVIAREIERRFLPEYTRILGRIKEKIVTERAIEDGKQDAFAEIQAGCGLPDTARHITELKTSWYDSGRTYGSVRVNSADSVDLEIHGVSRDKAIMLINIARAKG